ncbi:hypothetical protein WS48_07180 [Burkholderia sp. RF7-non_BP1]|nr:hypothetical protein WS48_07180 [Burkholderia sp. RF7-non_BP1]KUZ04623.1 hypothetical protein WS49_09730 [Burkholderia sp. RF7-non_BP4]
MEAGRLVADAGSPQRFVAACDRAWGDDRDVDFVTGLPIGHCGADCLESCDQYAERQRQRTLR